MSNLESIKNRRKFPFVFFFTGPIIWQNAYDTMYNFQKNWHVSLFRNIFFYFKLLEFIMFHYKNNSSVPLVGYYSWPL